MPSIILECPHCGAEKIGFHLAHEIPGALNPINVNKRYRAVLICPNCEEIVIATFDHRATTPFLQNANTPSQCLVDPTKLNWELTTTYPTPRPSTCPSWSYPFRYPICNLVSAAFWGSFLNHQFSSRPSQSEGGRKTVRFGIRGRSAVQRAGQLLAQRCARWPSSSDSLLRTPPG